MASRTCPYCNSKVALSDSTVKHYYFDTRRCYDHPTPELIDPLWSCELNIFTCPECYKVSVDLIDDVQKTHHVLPPNYIQRCPDYIPKQIADDFHEAQTICELSPKSAATLCRRCMQGMIHDFWGVHAGNLGKELCMIADRVLPETRELLDAVRRIGNIGAHMESDVNLIVEIEPHEAQILISLVGELINDWYVNRYNRQQLHARVLDLDEQLQQRRAHKG